MAQLLAGQALSGPYAWRNRGPSQRQLDDMFYSPRPGTRMPRLRTWRPGGRTRWLSRPGGRPSSPLKSARIANPEINDEIAVELDRFIVPLVEELDWSA